jgi:hypothetical protein
MTKAAIKDKSSGMLSLDPGIQERAEILERARDRLAELRYKCAVGLADPAQRGNTDLPIEELAKIQLAIDAIDEAIIDDRARMSKKLARSS